MVTFYCYTIQQHAFHLIRFFMFDFSSTLNPLIAFVINMIALGTLCRNFSLYYTCSTTDCSLNRFKSIDQTFLVKKRAEDAKTYLE